MRLSNNLNLPELSALQARSTWAIVIAAVITVFNALGVDLLAFAAQIGAGSTPEEVIATGDRLVAAWQTVAPLVLGFWAWVERRAPNYRLTLPGVTETTKTAAAMLAMAGLLACGAGRVFAGETPRCLPGEQMIALLGQSFGETMDGAGILSGEAGAAVGLFANAETGSWTIIALDEGKACILLFGSDWTRAIRAPPGDPA